METTLFYARAACNDAQVCCCRPAAERPFLLSPGRFLSGVLKTWQLTGEQKYLDYAAMNNTPLVR